MRLRAEHDALSAALSERRDGAQVARIGAASGTTALASRSRTRGNRRTGRDRPTSGPCGRGRPIVQFLHERPVQPGSARSPSAVAGVLRGGVEVVHGVHHEDDVGVELDRVGRVANEALRGVVRGDAAHWTSAPLRSERRCERVARAPAVGVLVFEVGVERRGAAEEDDPIDVGRLRHGGLASAEAAASSRPARRSAPERPAGYACGRNLQGARSKRPAQARRREATTRDDERLWARRRTNEFRRGGRRATAKTERACRGRGAASRARTRGGRARRRSRSGRAPVGAAE